MGMVNGNRLITQVISGATSGAQLQTALGNAATLASFTQALNSRGAARALAESATGLTAVAASSLACRAVGRGQVASAAMLATALSRSESMTRPTLASQILRGPLGPDAEPFTSWVNRTAVNANDFPLIWGAGVAVSIVAGTISSSTDMITWTTRTNPNATSCVRKSAVAYGNGMFLAVSTADGTAHTKAVTSTDGITWTARTLPTSLLWRGVVFSGDRFLIYGPANTTTYTSTDGVNWVSTGGNTPAGADFLVVLYGHGRYFGWTASGAVYVSSTGTGWQAPGQPWSSYTYAFGGGVFVGVNSASGATAPVFSADGHSWSMGVMADGTALPNYASTIEHHGGVFYAANSQNQGRYFVSNDLGKTWLTRAMPSMFQLSFIQGFSRGDGPLMAVGSSIACSHG